MKRLLRTIDGFSIALGVGCLLGTIGAIVLHADRLVPLLWSAIAWCIVVVLLIFRKHVESSVLWSAKLIGLTDVRGPLEEVAPQFAGEFTRFYYAARAFRADGRPVQPDLAANIRRIAKAVYQELRATAVEFALYDEVSQQWSQALVIGAPRTINSQGMLGDNPLTGERQIFTFESHQVIVTPVVFSGNVFGAIRAEVPMQQRPSRNDLDILDMYAIQGAMALVDAQFTNELLRMRRTSEETIRAKTGFLANLSHEIRGPLGIILNGTELMKDGLCGPVSEQQQSTLKMIRDSGDHLLDLVNDVLDYAKVEAGKIIPKTVHLSVEGMLEDLVAVVRSQAIEKGHSLELLPVDPSLGVSCDKRHARQMLINFLTNAVKYTPSGGSIIVSAQRVAGNKCRISVKDSGIGIPAEQADKVFAAFERVEDQYALAQGGTGLGMPLTRRLAEVNGGTVDFESEVGSGSVFWVILPCVHIEASAISQVERDQDEENMIPVGRAERVMVVDHDDATRKMMAQYLRSRGFVVHEAATGGEVLRILRDQAIEIALVENDMPDLPGEDMVTAIRSTPRAGSIPLVLLTSRAFVFDIERFLKLGVDRCLSKPVNLSEVAKTVRRLIDENRTIQIATEESAAEREHHS